MKIIISQEISHGCLFPQVTYLYFLHFKSYDLWEPNKTLSTWCNNSARLGPRRRSPGAAALGVDSRVRRRSAEGVWGILEHFSGRVGFGPDRKNPGYFGLKKSCLWCPTGQVDPSFYGTGSSWARAWADRPRNLHYKIDKNIYRADSGKK
jgi:hypothetical protein